MSDSNSKQRLPSIKPPDAVAKLSLQQQRPYLFTVCGEGKPKKDFKSAEAKNGSNSSETKVDIMRRSARAALDELNDVDEDLE